MPHRGMTGSVAIVITLSLFALITFPPLGLVVGFVGGLVLLAKWTNRRERIRSEQAHRARMDQFYFEQSWQNRDYTNPGWRP